MITCERQLTVGIDRRNNRNGRILVLPLRRHRNLVGELGGSEMKGKQRMFGGKKVRLGLRTRRCATTRYKWGFPGSDIVSQKC
jgi:hypothetical protein